MVSTGHCGISLPLCFVRIIGRPEWMVFGLCISLLAKWERHALVQHVAILALCLCDDLGRWRSLWCVKRYEDQVISLAFVSVRYGAFVDLSGSNDLCREVTIQTMNCSVDPQTTVQKSAWCNLISLFRIYLRGRRVQTTFCFPLLCWRSCVLLYEY